MNFLQAMLDWLELIHSPAPAPASRLYFRMDPLPKLPILFGSPLPTHGNLQKKMHYPTRKEIILKKMETGFYGNGRY